MTVSFADRNRVCSGVLAATDLRAAGMTLRVADGFHLQTARKSLGLQRVGFTGRKDLLRAADG